MGEALSDRVTPEEATWALPGGGRCQAVRAAVSSQDRHYGFLRHGVGNAGEASLYDLGGQALQGESVRLVAPGALPPCAVMKLDAEGAEREILEGYRHLSGVQVLAVEWHRKGEIPIFVRLCHEAGLSLTGANTTGRVLKFARQA
jgi:hypothetical protein